MSAAAHSSSEKYVLWLYSRSYHNQFLEISKLYEAGFYRPAFILINQLFENIIRSYFDDWCSRDMKKIFTKLVEDLEMTDDEARTINMGDSSLREVRNIVVHRDCSSYFFELNGETYSFSEQSTYKVVFDYFYSTIDICIDKMLNNLNSGMLENEGELSEEA